MKTTAIIASALIAAIAVAGSASAQDKTEKCYGVAKAGKNDCQTAKSSCAATSKTDAQNHAWVSLPKGVCDKLVGGKLSPG